MIFVSNPVELVRNNAMEIAQKVLKTDPTNISMSQWHVETHEENGEFSYVACCAINRRLDPLDTPLMLHMRAQDLEHIRLMFELVEWVA